MPILYEQVKGTLMSNFTTEAVMRKRGKTVLPKFRSKLRLHYVEDAFLIARQWEIRPTFGSFSESFMDIKFIREIEHDKTYRVLDVHVTRTSTGMLTTFV